MAHGKHTAPGKHAAPTTTDQDAQPTVRAVAPVQSSRVRKQAGKNAGNATSIGSAAAVASASGSASAAATPLNLGPRKKRSGLKAACISVLVILAFFAVVLGVEYGLNSGRVHRGITVEGISIGGMTEAEAQSTLNAAFDSLLSDASICVTPSAEALERLEDSTANDAVVEDDEEAASEEADASSDDDDTDDADAAAEAGSEDTLSWTFTATELGANVDVASLVDEAISVGRFTSWSDAPAALIERVRSWMGKINIEASVEFEEESFNTAVQTLDDALGVSMANYGIIINSEGVAQVSAGREGEQVDVQEFASLASETLLSGSTASFDAPLTSQPVDIDAAEAQVVADEITEAIAESVTFSYDGNSWEIDTVTLGKWTVIDVEGEGSDAALVASIDTAKAYDALRSEMGSVAYGTAVNASIDVSSGTPEIVGGTTGVGPDISSAVHELDELLYSDISSATDATEEADTAEDADDTVSDKTSSDESDGASVDAASRTIEIAGAEVEPEITADDAAEWGIVELIASYTLSYGTGDGSNRQYNVERALDSVNGSMVAPGENWKWNDIVGNCDTAAGYKDATVISNGVYSTASGGGICNAATGVFNAAYEAGLPIVERSNHSIYQERYPLGRDAAVSWEYPTLIFNNDTDHYILVTVEYDGYDMVVSIWGTSPNRTVESETGDWVTTDSGGKSITKYR